MKIRRKIMAVSMVALGVFTFSGCSSDADTVVNMAAISGVTEPVTGQAPVTEIEATDQYTGTVSWNPPDDSFTGDTVYTATITLTVKSGYTVHGVRADFFEVTGAESVSHDANSGVVTAVFPKTYSIGGTGPAGGLIFYIDEANAFDWNYLEVAPESTEWADVAWGPDQTEIGGAARQTGIGDGKAATQAIIAAVQTENIAARLCADLEHQHDGITFSDWFLPSRDELGAIWQNIVHDGTGGNSGVGSFEDEFYWTSSENEGDPGSEYAHVLFFSSGASSIAGKENPYWVRAIRAF